VNVLGLGPGGGGGSRIIVSGEGEGGGDGGARDRFKERTPSSFLQGSTDRSDAGRGAQATGAEGGCVVVVGGESSSSKESTVRSIIPSSQRTLLDVPSLLAGSFAI
jgi:hypothetical protein